jgi:EAL domain-containing protein (putative c-di-GMP-specific phosphodiesterase class I)
MAARPPVNPPVRAVVSTPGSLPTVPSLGQQLRDVLQGRRLHSVSVCDHEANVLWLSEGALGPDEHGVVVEALDSLGAEPSVPCYETALEDGRYALVLPVRAPTGHLVGVALILGDARSVGDDTQERLSAAPVRAIMQRLAVLLKPGDTLRPAESPANGTGPAGRQPASTADITGEELSLLELVPDIEPPVLQPTQPPPRAAAAPAAPPPTRGAAPAPAIPSAIPAEQVDDILEFELPADEGPPPATQRLNGARGVSTSRSDTQSDMVSLEFLPDEPLTAPAARPAQADPPASSAPTAAAAPARSVPPAPAVTPAARAVPATSGARREPAVSVQPPAAATPQSDPNLILEVVPYAKLRTGGQTRRFQIQARLAPRVAQCDPAVLDALILQRLLDWLAAYRALWTSQPTCFTLNLSIATLEDERFAQKVSAELNAHGIAAEALGFEIAETLVTQRRAQVERFIAQCEKLGTPVVIDDFSFDSQVLPLLRSKAVRLVKIDPKLTAAALKDKLAQALVIATVQAAKVLGIHCAAKRVDSQAAAQWLGAIGCDFGQGAALSGPKSLEALVASPDATGLTTLINRPQNINNQ